MKRASKSREIFSRQVKKQRKLKSIRLEDIQEATKLSYSYLSMVENGRANISIDNAHAIAECLGVPLATLFIE
jgi:transcriptional regulator with XRE-family HTH domain